MLLTPVNSEHAENLRMLAKLTLQLESTWQRADYCACVSDVRVRERYVIGEVCEISHDWLHGMQSMLASEPSDYRKVKWLVLRG